MIGALALAWLQGEAPAASLSVDATAGPIEVGAPFEALVSVRHPDGTRAAISAWDLDYGWEVIETGAAHERLDAASGWRVTERRFELLGLEAGAHRLLAPPITVSGLSNGELSVAANPVELELAAVLAPGEDAPRPLGGFRPAPATAPDAARWPAVCAVAAGAGALCALAGALLGLRRARRRPAPAPALEPLARLRQLESAPREGEAAAALHAELARLVRGAVEPRPAAHLPDEEWLAALAAHERALVEPVLARAARVRFGSERPTTWATQETLGLARAALEALVVRARDPNGPGRSAA